MFDDGYTTLCETLVAQGDASGSNSIGHDAYCGCVDYLDRSGAGDRPQNETTFADDCTAGEA